MIRWNVSHPSAAAAAAADRSQHSIVVVVAVESIQLAKSHQTFHSDFSMSKEIHAGGIYTRFASGSTDCKTQNQSLDRQWIRGEKLARRGSLGWLSEESTVAPSAIGESQQRTDTFVHAAFLMNTHSYAIVQVGPLSPKKDSRENRQMAAGFSRMAPSSRPRSPLRLLVVDESWSTASSRSAGYLDGQTDSQTVGNSAKWSLATPSCVRQFRDRQTESHSYLE